MYVWYCYSYIFSSTYRSLISWDINYSWQLPLTIILLLGLINKMKFYRPPSYPEAEILEAILKPSLSRAFLAPSILKHINQQPTTLGNWQQCPYPDRQCNEFSPIFFSLQFFSFLFLRYCSSYVHSGLTVIFNVGHAGAGHPFSSIRHCSSSVFDESSTPNSMSTDAGVLYQIFISG